ncbi:MAG: exodeoxyribonuclease VII large subunit [Candidatus Aminicenantes bacterium]|nr:exodeoxyribonuclease VII large subunit [Candidatus Aminicenantes bacterium]
MTIADKVYTVSEITTLIKHRLESSFSVVWVEGEISDFKRAHSGHIYYTLKDEKSQLRAVSWRSSAQRIPFDLENGLHVICKGQINVYEPRGQYQIIVEVMEPKGKGALQLAFEQLKEKLNKEGLFDSRFKKKLPLLPKKIGLLTSPRGAAIIDIIRTLERRFAKLSLVIYPVKVQGKGAAEEIEEGLDFFGRELDMDVIIVGRGGGSMEDLWVFNEERVARAIFRCPIPVISAVGHEVDFTISDFVADIRASTPSAAAEMVVEKEQSFQDWIANLESRLQHHLSLLLQMQKNKVLSLVHHHAFESFKLRLLGLIQRVDELETRAGDAIKDMRRRMVESKSRAAILEGKMTSLLKGMVQTRISLWERLSAELDNLSPLNVLKKGYTLCWMKEGRVLVRTIDEVKEKDEVNVTFAKGEFRCLVQSVDREKPIESRFVKPEKANP